MNKKDFIEKINNIIEYISDGKVKYNDETYNGHPSFYLNHSKEELNNKLKCIIKDKEVYDRYDLFYYVNYIFKYMLNPYDLHTRIMFTDYKYLPIIIKFIDDEVYIVDGNNLKGSKILKINDIDINDIIKEFDNIICYSSKEFFHIMLEDYLININALKSLPNMNDIEEFKITTDKEEIVFDLNNIKEFKYNKYKPNYNLEIKNNIAIITYNSCTNKNGMINLVNNLKKLNNISNYIIDLRDNGGGDSSINDYLIEFLKNKKVVVLCNENVFSSGIMCLIDLKNIGATVIGTNPASPINHFGNSMMCIKLKDMDLMVLGSVTYWYYDEEFICHGIYKNNFNESLNSNTHLLDLVFFNVDIEKKLNLDDYINNKDSVLEYVLKYLGDKNDNKND